TSAVASIARSASANRIIARPFQIARTGCTRLTRACKWNGMGCAWRRAMPYQDFRQFLDVLRQQGELIDVDRPVALTDVGKALKQAYQKGRPAVSFNDNSTEYPLVCGLYSDRNK